MIRRSWALAVGLAAVSVLVGGSVVAVAAGTAQPVTCSYDGATLTCPIPQATTTVTTTATATVTATATASPTATVSPTPTVTTTTGPLTFTQTALSANVSGSSVSVSTTVTASTATAVTNYKVCIYNVSGTLDWPALATATLTPSGTTFNGAAKTFANGTWTYSACFQKPGGAWWNGPTKTFTTPGPIVTTTAATPTTATSTAATVTPTATVPASVKVSKLLVVVEENHSYSQMRSSMPYLNGLANQYGYASNYHGITHPSEPNYLAIAGGDTFGVTDNGDPSVHPISGPSVFGQAVSAKVYNESMPANCTLTGNTDKGYAVKHNPWAFFVDERASCNQFDVSSVLFLSDAQANALPVAGMFVPNKCDDGHDTDLGCDLTTADNYLKTLLPTVLASTDFTSGKLAVVVTADEDDTFAGSTSGNPVLTVVLQAGLAGKVVADNLTHYSLARLYSQVSGAAPLRNAATAPDMAAAFGLAVGP